MTLAEDKHRQILDAAVTEFQARGFAAASMDRIAQAAGVSKRTVYNHFDGKADLFRAILDRMEAYFVEHLTVTYTPGEPIAPQLAALAWSEGRILTSEPCMRMARMVMGETMRDPDLAAALNARVGKLAVFRNFIAAAHADGALNAPDPDLAAAQFLGLIKSQGFWPQITTGTAVTTEAMRHIVDSTVRMFISTYGS